jgi:hypothetical protein
MAAVALMIPKAAPMVIAGLGSLAVVVKKIGGKRGKKTGRKGRGEEGGGRGHALRAQV